MAARSFLRFAALAATLLAGASCVYPFDVEIPETEYPVVVEGDIHVGSTTTLTVSRVFPINNSSATGGPAYYSPYSSSSTGYMPGVLINLKDCYIEGEDGTRIPGTSLHGGLAPHLSGTYLPTGEGIILGGPVYFDTSQLRADQRYRMHIDISEDILETDWIEVCKAPVIDALSYQKNENYQELRIGLSMHCSGSSFFRWSFSETWEYHSYVNSDLCYNPQSMLMEKYWANGQPSNYYCWKEVSGGQIKLFSTENQTDDRFEDLAFHRIALDDMRLQVLYRITVQLEAMSREAYAYWNNIRQNSEEQGSLFAPIPSQMTGNIHCLTTPNRGVIGYINAAQPAEAVLYYDNSKEQFYDPTRYRPDLNPQKVSAGDIRQFDDLYRSGFLPYQEIYEGLSSYPTHYMWGTADCIDCRKLGGTKNKPKDWPSGHN